MTKLGFSVEIPLALVQDRNDLTESIGPQIESGIGNFATLQTESQFAHVDEEVETIDKVSDVMEDLTHLLVPNDQSDRRFILNVEKPQSRVLQR
jgi:hypothetical protein